MRHWWIRSLNSRSLPQSSAQIENRLIRALGTPFILKDHVYYGYPTPQTLAETTDSGFRSCGLTRRKGEYIQGISQLIIAKSLNPENFRTYKDPEIIIRELAKIRDIGRWTAELTVLRGLHRPDAFPADNIGVRRFVGQFYMNHTNISSAQYPFIDRAMGALQRVCCILPRIADMLGTVPFVS